MKIIGLNGRQFSIDELTQAVKNSKSGPAVITVLASNSGVLETYEIKYHGGGAYPHLERVQSGNNYLEDILKPLTGPPAASQ